MTSKSNISAGMVPDNTPDNTNDKVESTNPSLAGLTRLRRLTDLIRDTTYKAEELRQAAASLEEHATRLRALDISATYSADLDTLELSTLRALYDVSNDF